MEQGELSQVLENKVQQFEVVPVENFVVTAFVTALLFYFL